MNTDQPQQNLGCWKKFCFKIKSFIHRDRSSINVLTQPQIEQKNITLSNQKKQNQIFCHSCYQVMDEGVFLIHIKMCEQQIINQNLVEQECEQCGRIIIKYYINDHLEVCEGNFWIQVKCPYCFLAFFKADLSNHIVQCPTFKEQQIKEQNGIKNCPICLEDIQENKTQLDCSHSFHIECIKNWLSQQKKCPVCKKKQQIIE